MRLSDLAAEAGYENGVLRVSPNTYQRSYKNVTHRLVEYFGDVPLHTLTPADIDRWQRHLDQDDLSTHTANSYKSTARAMLNHVGAEELAGVIRLRKPPPRPSKAMRPEHFYAMLRHANARDAAILLLLRDSGRRRATIPQLRADNCRIWQGADGDFRFAGRAVEKGEADQLVFAGHQATLAVISWMEMRPYPDSPWLFTRLDGPDPIATSYVTVIFRRLKEQAQIPKRYNCNPHALRHAFAQKKLEEFDAKVVAQWMGISVDTVLGVYATRSADELERLFFGDDARPGR